MSHHPPSSPPPLEIDDSDDDFGDFGNVFDKKQDVTQPIKDVVQPVKDYFGGPPSFSDNDDFGDFGDFPSSSSISKAAAMFSPPPLENGMSPESPQLGLFADFPLQTAQNDEMNNFSDLPPSNKAEDSISKASAMFSPPPLENGNSYESSPAFGKFADFPSSTHPVESNTPAISDFGNFLDSSPPEESNLQDIQSNTNDSARLSPPNIDNKVETSPDFGAFAEFDQSQAEPNMFSVCDEDKLSQGSNLDIAPSKKIDSSPELQMPAVDSDDEFGNFDQKPSKELVVPDFSYQFTDSLPTPSPLTAQDPMRSVFTWDSVEESGDEPMSEKVPEEDVVKAPVKLDPELELKVPSEESVVSDPPFKNNLVPPQHNLSMLSDDDDFSDFDFSAPLSANVVTSPNDDTPYHVREVPQEEKELRHIKTKLDFDESSADEEDQPPCLSDDDFGDFDAPSDPSVPEVDPSEEVAKEVEEVEVATPLTIATGEETVEETVEEAAAPPRAKVLSGCFSTDDEFADFDFAAPVSANVVISEECTSDHELQPFGGDEQNVFDFDDEETSSPAVEEESSLASFDTPPAAESDDDFGNFDTPTSESIVKPEASFDPFNTAAADSDDGFSDFGNFRQPEPSEPSTDDGYASFSKPAEESEDEFGNFDKPSVVKDDDDFGKFSDDDDDFGDFDNSPKPFAAFEPTNDNVDEFGDFEDDNDDFGNFDDNDDGFAKFSAPLPNYSSPPSGKTVGQVAHY